MFVDSKCRLSNLAHVTSELIMRLNGPLKGTLFRGTFLAEFIKTYLCDSTCTNWLQRTMIVNKLLVDLMLMITIHREGYPRPPNQTNCQQMICSDNYQSQIHAHALYYYKLIYEGRITLLFGLRCWGWPHRKMITVFPKNLFIKSLFKFRSSKFIRDAINHFEFKKSKSLNKRYLIYLK